jgi:hypothetical protein
LPIAATYYQTSGTHATYYNAALRTVQTLPTLIAATYYSWSVSVTLPSKGLYEVTAVPWSTNNGLWATFYDTAQFSNAVAAFTQSSIDVSMSAPVLDPSKLVSRLGNFGFGVGANVSDLRAFSARWRGFVRSTASNVLTFSVTLKSKGERAKLWVDGMLLLNFDDYPNNILSAVATVAVSTTDSAALQLSGVCSLFEVVLEYQKLPLSSANCGVQLTYNTLLTGYYYSENHAVFPQIVVLPAAVCAGRSSVSGPGLTRATAGVLASFSIQLRDEYSSATAFPSFSEPEAIGSHFVVVRILPNVCEVSGRCSYVLAEVSDVDAGLGKYQASYKIIHKGSFNVVASVAVLGKLTATYYAASSFSGSRSTVSKRYSAAAVSVAAGSGSVRFQGFLRPPQAGPYTVFVVSTSAVTVGMRLADPVTNIGVTGTSSGNAAATFYANAARSLYDIMIDFDSGQSATLMWKYGSMAAAAVIPAGNLYSRDDISNAISINTLWGLSGVVVLAAESCASLSLVGGSGLSIATAGVAAKLTITAVDSYRNDRAVFEDTWLVRIYSSCCGNFSASVFPDSRALQPAVYTDASYGERTGPGRYTAWYLPTRSGSYTIGVQRLSLPGLRLQIFCSGIAVAAPCQETVAAQPLVDLDTFKTEAAVQSVAAGHGVRAVWTGFLLVQSSETLTFSVVANGSVSLRIDDQVGCCGQSLCLQHCSWCCF